MPPINFTALYKPHYVVALITALLLTAEIGAQTINTTKLDTLFARLDANNKAMATVTVYKNGKVLYNKSIGYKKIEGTTKQVADVHTKYRIGSITKMFTATMIFELVDEKKLTLDTKLSQFFPKITNADKITIGNMLNHHSGIHNFTNDDAFTTYNTAAKTQTELLDMFYKMPADFEPGKKGQYSNTNYVLLGYIIEKVTGKSYAHELKTRITNKIGLKETYYGGPADVKKNEAYSYNFETKNWQQEQETNMDIPHGAGAIVATSTDLTKFATALFQGKLISDSLLKKMKTDTDDYGYGCFEMPFREHTSYGHTGGIDGFSSMLGYFPSDSLAVAIVSNGINYSLNEIMINVLNIVYYQYDYKIPTFTSIALNPDKLAAYEGLYAAPGFPLKITVKAVDDKLTAQATGQNSFVLDAKSKTLFKFDSAGITMDFIIEDGGIINQFNFSQGSLELLFTKEK
jgi:D-alanyl-D-alanine carboxypeptidase